MMNNYRNFLLELEKHMLDIVFSYGTNHGYILNLLHAVQYGLLGH